MDIGTTITEQLETSTENEHCIMAFYKITDVETDAVTLTECDDETETVVGTYATQKEAIDAAIALLTA